MIYSSSPRQSLLHIEKPPKELNQDLAAARLVPSPLGYSFGARGNCSRKDRLTLAHHSKALDWLTLVDADADSSLVTLCKHISKYACVFPHDVSLTILIPTFVFECGIPSFAFVVRYFCARLLLLVTAHFHYDVLYFHFSLLGGPCCGPGHGST